jgi:broad specificity phosphatase PhoE
MRPPDSGRLVLIRHSVPEARPHVAAADWPLSELGRQRARSLAGRLETFQLRAVYSSLEIKAVETAEIICRPLNLTNQAVENLHEHDRRGSGYLEREAFEKNIQALFANPDRLVFGNETADQARRRFTGAVQPLLEANPLGTIAVVSHGTVITLFVSHLLGLESFELWSSLALPSFLVLDVRAKELLAQENFDERSQHGIG